MAKRQERITVSTIRQKWPEISGKKVNIVLTNGTVLMVRLNELTEDYLKVRNMRLKLQKIAIEEVAEIIIDY